MRLLEATKFSSVDCILMAHRRDKRRVVRPMYRSALSIKTADSAPLRSPQKFDEFAQEFKKLGIDLH